MRVRCPRGSDLELRASSADLEATGPLGAVDVKTASGDVTLEDVGAARGRHGQRRRARSRRRRGAAICARHPVTRPWSRCAGAVGAISSREISRSARQRRAGGDDGLGRRARARRRRWRHPGPVGLGRRAPRDQARRAPLHRCELGERHDELGARSRRHAAGRFVEPRSTSSASGRSAATCRSCAQRPSAPEPRRSVLAGELLGEERHRVALPCEIAVPGEEPQRLGRRRAAPRPRG